MAIINSISLLILIIPIVVGIGLLSILQIYLSKNKSASYGKILPIISFAISIIFVLIIVFSIVSFTSVNSDSNIPEVEIIPNIRDTGVVIFYSIILFIILNIPTIIFTLIYKNERNKIKIEELESMKIKDL